MRKNQSGASLLGLDESLERVRLLVLKAKVERLTKQAENMQSSRSDVVGQEELIKVIKYFFEDIISVLALWKDINDAQDFAASSLAAIPFEITKSAEWETFSGKLCRLEEEMESRCKFMYTTSRSVYLPIIMQSDNHNHNHNHNHNYAELLNDLLLNIKQLRNDIAFFKKIPNNEINSYKKLEKELDNFAGDIRSLLKFLYAYKNLAEPSLWCLSGNSLSFFHCEPTEESSEQLPQGTPAARCVNYQKK